MFHHLCSACDTEWEDDDGGLGVECPECGSLDVITTGDEFNAEGGI